MLKNVRPTDEQLPILQDYRPGCVLIRGAAGSGKTTTAVLRLRHVTGVWANQRDREESAMPVRVMVMTYNRTLRGYVEELVNEQIEIKRFALRLSTFGRWGWKTLGEPAIADTGMAAGKLWQLGAGLGYTREFLLDEVEYVLGRYMPEDIGLYLTPDQPQYERRGRGLTPRVERPQRERLVREVLEPYAAWKAERGERDWSDIAVAMARRTPPDSDQIDVLVVDEAQDFSANQIRGLMRHLAPQYSATFVLDAMQRIYPRGFTWPEAGVDIIQRYPLKKNHRNTKQVAAFAEPLVSGLAVDDDGTLPDFTTCEEDGPLPQIVRGRFSEQMQWVVRTVRAFDPDESVALLHAKGGGWFSFVRQALDRAGIPHVDLQRREDWPQGEEQVGLCTLQSAKGLEFDHVVLLGLASEQLPHGLDEEDAQMTTYQRLIAMAIGRARRTVTVTYKPGEEPRVIDLLDPATFEVIDL